MTVTFKTRARTLDMLGRQQIAGIPTAINELFKNAYDAYADCVEIDYFRSDGLFVLRDDGIGMSRNDFISRWLTLGTDSKFDPKNLPISDPDKDPRPMLGEKGIGRLAIATIGPQVLVLTRAKTTDMKSSDITAAFINWNIFEWPSLDLEDIKIPLRSFPPNKLPTGRDVTEMVEEFRENVNYAKNKVEDKLIHSINSELEDFDVDPSDIDTYLKIPSLKKEFSGTHFIIKPASELLVDEIDGDIQFERLTRSSKATPLKKALLGFSNNMIPNPQFRIETAFRDHKTDEIYDDLIAEREFFSPDEFKNTDHQIMGNFDEFGQFKGDISIYGDMRQNHIIQWGGSQGRKTKCGPFTIHFAAIEGESRLSTIPLVEYSKLAKKTEQLGGLYIYRNGIRILPYGDTDVDWLGIEERRTKGAGYYYFSHRKMFGFVNIDAEKNNELKEKAGREGFQQNKAYRQFRSILANLFVQLASDFFRVDGVYNDVFHHTKARLIREDEIRKSREKLVSMKKIEFERELDLFFEKTGSNIPLEEAANLEKQIINQIKSSRPLDDKKILSIDRQVKAEIRDLEYGYKITRPKIGLKKATLRNWELYKVEFKSLQENVFVPLSNSVSKLIEEVVVEEGILLNWRASTEIILDTLGQELKNEVLKSRKEIQSEVEKIANSAKDVAGRSIKTVDSELREVLSEFHRIDFEGMEDEDFIETRSNLENRIIKITEEQNEILTSIIEQLNSIDLTGIASTNDQLMAIEQRNILLEEEAEADAQLVQLGMAIEIINHEFSATIRSIRNGLRKLKAWADVNEGLDELYNNIRGSFDHLDSYLTLFTPLHKRLQRRAVEIKGSEIRVFLEDLFKTRLERHNVSLSATKNFNKAKIIGYPSSFYPVFVNLVDNAIFWLAQQNPKYERAVNLDEKHGMLLVEDTGPGINPLDEEAIFEFGFTRKPGGRGMGLYISRETLRRDGYDLNLHSCDRGATFCIEKKSDREK